MESRSAPLALFLISPSACLAEQAVRESDLSFPKLWKLPSLPTGNTTLNATASSSMIISIRFSTRLPKRWVDMDCLRWSMPSAWSIRKICLCWCGDREGAGLHRQALQYSARERLHIRMVGWVISRWIFILTAMMKERLSATMEPTRILPSASWPSKRYVTAKPSFPKHWRSRSLPTGNTMWNATASSSMITSIRFSTRLPKQWVDMNCLRRSMPSAWYIRKNCLWLALQSKRRWLPPTSITILNESTALHMRMADGLYLGGNSY